MRIKKVLGLMMAIAMVGMVTVPSITSEAAGLTQATTTDQVIYGKVSDADKALLMQLFDAEYYLAQNPDLAELYGDDIEALFNHFCTLGIFEGRTCNANFDPSAYASAYEDLSLFGNDILKYYEHYLTVGVAENRNITTLAACAENGITVTSIVAPEIVITPATYKVATLMGTTDIAAVEYAIERAVVQAAESAQPVAITYGDTSVVIAPDSGSSSSGNSSSGNSAVLAEAKGMTYAGKIEAGSGEFGVFFSLYVIKGTSGGYGVHTGEIDAYSATAVTSTAGYTAPNDIQSSDIVANAQIYLTPTPNGIEVSPSAGPSTNVTETSKETSGTEEADPEYPSIVLIYDSNGTATTEYNVTTSISENTDGSIDFSIGAYNEADGFAVVADYEITDDGE
ncbi:MAG: hypothetical protein J6P79_13705 [Pseudobutyrivibrio sp.]|nr:hypothetical protein [Pseudobutyrivibrio sp.]